MGKGLGIESVRRATVKPDNRALIKLYCSKVRNKVRTVRAQLFEALRASARIQTTIVPHSKYDSPHSNYDSFYIFRIQTTMGGLVIHRLWILPPADDYHAFTVLSCGKGHLEV